MAAGPIKRKPSNRTEPGPQAARLRITRPTHLITLGLVGVLGALAGWYATLPPKDIDDACALFREHRSWYEQARDVERRWGTPIALQMAILRQESSFRCDARPPRKLVLGVIPWDYRSSAYGYAQAIDATWYRYQRHTGNQAASRDSFADAVDFVGWYTHQSRARYGIPHGDAFSQYLAYHEGHEGFQHRSYDAKPGLLVAARKVEDYADRYRMQLEQCRGLL